VKANESVHVGVLSLCGGDSHKVGYSVLKGLLIDFKCDVAGIEVEIEDDDGKTISRSLHLVAGRDITTSRV
jgi:hypothetical protein